MNLPGGVFPENYKDDTAIVRTRHQWVLVVCLLVVLVMLPYTLSDYALGLVNIIAITIIAVHGLSILTGFAGQISLGQAAFMAVGAYTSAFLTTKTGLPFWVSLPCAGLSGGFIGLLFGLPAVRIKGFYLAMTTLAAQFIITYVILHWTDVTNGAMGLSAPRPTLGGFVFRSEQSWYLLIMTITVLMTLLAKNIARGKIGRAFIAIRDNDIAADAMGINLFSYKLLAFFICSFYAGIAGSLWAHYVGMAHLDYFTLTNSIWYLGMLIVGGLGSVVGAILGVVLMRSLDESVTRLTPVIADAFPSLEVGIFAAAGLIAYGLVLVFFLIFEPRGLSHRWETIKAYYRLWPYSN